MRLRPTTPLLAAIALLPVLVVLALLSPAATQPAVAGGPELTIVAAGAERRFDRDALLARPDAVTVDIPADVSYGGPMRYRAVPLASLLGVGEFAPGSVLEGVASDGFTAQLPPDLCLRTGPDGAVAFLAVEPPDRPWPALPGKQVSAGPFYLVWVRPEASGVRSEQWPYQLTRIVSSDDPLTRWPQLAVDAGLAAESPARAGQAVFITQCMACHTLNGAGSATMGPDLNRPMNPTDYLTPDGLKRLVRDPRAVRTWPGQQMPGFDPSMLSDADLERVIAYLGHMAGRKQP
ncbi:c-type cytochrome [Azospirillum picis]|uniref:Mono/diheme cytochrome c family protein n=1 Tax=Azospirillum picis TaxID=488438 RepID=A0ABU0MLB5_9PROT|nr:cytochrome c [Azospirillum picis]MBP2300466.1 mono/diheme cytochrome c family protein [Azospirillum picis]MDQ0534262.1 mono/diheme cytochrome c family protein [Azospirillum picis]